MSDLKQFQNTMESCNHCGQCKWLLPARMSGWDFAEVCPIHEYFGFDAYSGQGLVNIAHEVMRGKLSHDDELARMMLTCTACGACDVNCKSVRDMEVLDTILELRADSAEKGFTPEPIKETGKMIMETHNSYGKPHSERFSWLPADYIDDTDSDTALFVGCSVYKYPQTAVAAIKILKAGGVKFRLLYEDEWCCGSALWRSGQRDMAEKLIKRNVETFKRLGIKRIITCCAECFGSFRAGYPRFCETEFEAYHMSQIIDDLIRKGKLRLSDAGANITVTYHDPCMLGRLSEKFYPWSGEIRSYGLHVPEKKWRRGENGVYEPPRDVLRAIPGVTLYEMARCYEEAWCCCDHASDIDPDFAAHASNERLREAAAAGAEAIVSCCPFCRDSLDRDNKVKYMDLTEFVSTRIVEDGLK